MLLTRQCDTCARRVAGPAAAQSARLALNNGHILDDLIVVTNGYRGLLDEGTLKSRVAHAERQRLREGRLQWEPLTETLQLTPHRVRAHDVPK